MRGPVYGVSLALAVGVLFAMPASLGDSMRWVRHHGGDWTCTTDVEYGLDDHFRVVLELGHPAEKLRGIRARDHRNQQSKAKKQQPTDQPILVLVFDCARALAR